MDGKKKASNAHSTQAATIAIEKLRLWFSRNESQVAVRALKAAVMKNSIKWKVHRHAV